MLWCALVYHQSVSATLHQSCGLLLCNWKMTEWYSTCSAIFLRQGIVRMALWTPWNYESTNIPALGLTNWYTQANERQNYNHVLSSAIFSALQPTHTPKYPHIGLVGGYLSELWSQEIEPKVGWALFLDTVVYICMTTREVSH